MDGFERLRKTKDCRGRLQARQDETSGGEGFGKRIIIIIKEGEDDRRMSGGLDEELVWYIRRMRR